MGAHIMNKLDAIVVLQRIHAKVNQDFHTLTRDQVIALLEEADRVKYRKPKNANGSRGRYFYSYISRRARQPL
jgi:hypothetical protein